MQPLNGVPERVMLALVTGELTEVDQNLSQRPPGVVSSESRVCSRVGVAHASPLPPLRATRIQPEGCGKLNEGAVPVWSGEFYETEDGVGVISVHACDESQPRPPKGWHLESVFVDTENDCQSFVYQKVA